MLRSSRVCGRAVLDVGVVFLHEGYLNCSDDDVEDPEKSLEAVLSELGLNGTMSYYEVSFVNNNFVNTAFIVNCVC